jgi:glycosyltransferase involved in cell wall biosynthesis
MLLAGIGVATRLAYTHADVIPLCQSLQPHVEVELGTDGARVYSRSQFRRKIDPIVNGISDMDGYKFVDKIRTEKPTVVMLSNVQFIKGVKAAIQSADIIVNRFGFTDYKLVVYGAKDRQPAYALEMEKLIVERNLSEHVVLAGFGNSKEVLKDAWLFMNSSISEGLPLAIGEAALAGVPIVATEVGATALVLTDAEDPTQRYGEVVPPNDPVGLARADQHPRHGRPVGQVYRAKGRDDAARGHYRRRRPVAHRALLHALGGPPQARSAQSQGRAPLVPRLALHPRARANVLIQWHLACMRADPALKALRSSLARRAAQRKV